MRKTKKNMKFRNKNKNYYKRYSNNRAYINRRLPLLANAGMIANRSSPTRVQEGLPVGTLSSLIGSSSVPEGTLLTTSDYEDQEHLPLTYNPASRQSYNAWREAVEDYHRDPKFKEINEAYEAGYNDAWYEATHPLEMLQGLPSFPSRTRALTRAEKNKSEHIERGYQTFAVERNKQRIIRKQVRDHATKGAYKDARAWTRKSNIRTALLSAALGAAAAHGAHLYMGANQPQPPQPTQSYMSLPSGMQQSLADLTRSARGKKRTRRRHKNRK
jgi:hypothetical protein